MSLRVLTAAGTGVTPGLDRVSPYNKSSLVCSPTPALVSPPSMLLTVPGINIMVWQVHHRVRHTISLCSVASAIGYSQIDLNTSFRFILHYEML